METRNWRRFTARGEKPQLYEGPKAASSPDAHGPPRNWALALGAGWWVLIVWS